SRNAAVRSVQKYVWDKQRLVAIMSDTHSSGHLKCWDAFFQTAPSGKNARVVEGAITSWDTFSLGVAGGRDAPGTVGHFGTNAKVVS
ncbi:MAG: hypothetical protein ACJ72Z_00190, partial [Pyrinomonadaceae bacterium]